MIKLAVAGASGRMGVRILTLAAGDPTFKIVGGLETDKHPMLGTDIGSLIGIKRLGVNITGDTDAVFKAARVVIDFTHHSALTKNLKAAVKNKTAYVLGTTGLTAAHFQSLKQAAKKVSIVQAPNMSVGVNLLFKLTELTAKALDEGYDIELTETHHRMKKDAPSGTAAKLLELIKSARQKAAKKIIYGREGEVGARTKGEIGAFALRGGDVVGDHTVFFFGDGERIELTHRASSRDAFAQGALRAAKFISKRKNGLFDMQQVLGFQKS